MKTKTKLDTILVRFPNRRNVDQRFYYNPTGTHNALDSLLCVSGVVKLFPKLRDQHARPATRIRVRLSRTERPGWLKFKADRLSFGFVKLCMFPGCSLQAMVLTVRACQELDDWLRLNPENRKNVFFLRITKSTLKNEKARQP